MADTVAASAADTTTTTTTADAGASTGAPAVASGTAAADTAAATAAAASTAAAGTVLTDLPKADDKAASDANGAKPGEQAGDKAADKTAAAAVPEKYELKLPDAPTLDQAALDRTAAFARERGLSPDAAQAALELANTEASAAVKAANDRFIADYSPGDPKTNTPPGREWAKMQTEWRAASLAHPEIGNGKPEQFDATMKQAGRAFQTYATDGFREFLDKTGYGSHPEVVRVFAKIGAAMAEGSFVAAGAQSSGRMSDTDVFYSKKE